MKRGDICLVNLDPSFGSEANKTRPAVVVSRDEANSAAQRIGRGVVTVVPLTSNVTRILAFQVLLLASETGLDRDSKAQAEQVRAVALERVGKVIGRLNRADLEALNTAQRLHLQL